MGNASLAGRRFRLDPTSIRWEFSPTVADQPTVGGKVVQIVGTSISDMTVTGTFGAGGWEEQVKFLERMKDLATAQVASASQSRSNSGGVIRFLYPDKNWDFKVYLKAYSNPEGSRSVAFDNKIVAPKWTLTLFIVEENTNLKRIAQDAYLARLSKGLGWRQTSYNGPMNEDELTQALEGKTVGEYLTEQFGLATDVSTAPPTGDQGASTVPSAGNPGTVTAGGGGTPDQNRALGKKIAAEEYGWSGAQWDALLELWNGESGWNHQADNPSSSAYGIAQALVKYPGRVMPKGYYDPALSTGEGGSFHGRGGDPAVQIRWGLNYIKGAYGSPAAALAKWKSRNPHWY
jgi:hypothetical protein